MSSSDPENQRRLRSHTAAEAKGASESDAEVTDVFTAGWVPAPEAAAAVDDGEAPADDETQALLAEGIAA